MVVHALSRLLLLAGLAVASALHCAVRPLVVQSAISRGSAPQMVKLKEILPKSGTLGPLKPPPLLDEEGNVVSEIEDEEQEQESQLVLMSTRLGNEVDLSPMAGPPVPVDDGQDDDNRPVFACFSVFAPKQATSDALRERYSEWVDNAEAVGTTICHSFYLLAAAATDGAFLESQMANCVVRRAGPYLPGSARALSRTHTHASHT